METGGTETGGHCGSMAILLPEKQHALSQLSTMATSPHYVLPCGPLAHPWQVKKPKRGEAESFSGAKAEPRIVNARTQVDFSTSQRGAPCSPQQGREGGWASPPRCDTSHSAYN